MSDASTENSVGERRLFRASLVNRTDVAGPIRCRAVPTLLFELMLALRNSLLCALPDGGHMIHKEVAYPMLAGRKTSQLRAKRFPTDQVVRVGRIVRT